jgi:membrane protease YdiL (CAAX protease family)
MTRTRLARTKSGWHPVHGAVLLAALGMIGLNPIFGRWPWFWIVPLSGYLLVATLVPPLRRTIFRPRVGVISARNCLATLGIMVLSSASLLIYQAAVQPDATSLGAALPVRALGGLVLAGIFFALLNATLEELVFRGVLFESLEPEWGWQVAVIATAVLFGLGHVHGYPPGWPGVCLATTYGVVLGALRVMTGGLLLPICAHVVADVTIYGILGNAGAI